MIRVEPRFPGNPRKHAWLDLASGVTLRTELYDSSGHLVSRSEFLQFSPQRSLPASLFAVPDVSRQTDDATRDRRAAVGSQPARSSPGIWRLTAGVSEGRLSFEPALPRYLPRGYVLGRLTRTHTDGTEVAWALFTDGLNTLSLVQWRGRREPPDGGRERFWGPGDRIRWSIGPINAMLAGDLAAAELKRIAGSIGPPRSRLGSLVTRK
jgi:negative regulator of sigma E activity